MRGFLKRISADLNGVEVNDAGLDFDIHGPAEYERAHLGPVKTDQSGHDASPATATQSQRELLRAGNDRFAAAALDELHARFHFWLH